MRRFHATSRGFSLIEACVALAIGFILMMMGMTAWVTWERSFIALRNASKAYQDAFGMMNAIQEQAQSANTIELLTGGTSTGYGTVVGTPGNTAYSGILLLVPQQNTTKTGPTGVMLNHAYWLSGKNLMMQWVTEGIGPLTLYSDVTAFTAAMLNAPTNSLVQLNCTCADGTETISMSTVAWSRN